MADGQVATAQIPWKEVNRSRATQKERQANIVLGDAEQGLSVAEIARLLLLQKSSVMGYLVRPYRRADLFRRLFEDDARVRERALALVSARRSSGASVA